MPRQSKDSPLKLAMNKQHVAMSESLMAALKCV
jgi:hypothetical protein